MIESYKLETLLTKYGLDVKKVLGNNDNVLVYGEYLEIDKTLDYLVNELNISPRNIEKAPSVMYRNTGDIKSNVNFLRQKNINFETCLHVLSSETDSLIDTYNYVKNNYGENVINKVTSVLGISKNKIIAIENLNIPNITKNDIISISVGINNIDEIEKIINIEVFKRRPELLTSEVLARGKSDEIEKIINIEVFKRRPELLTSTVLARGKLDEIEKIINIEVFKRRPELLTSTVLARGKLDEIEILLSLEYWEDDRFKNLLSPIIIANSKKMINKIPLLIEIAEEYNIDNQLNSSYFIKSPSQVYALINYMNDNNLDLVVNEKLNSMFSCMPGTLEKKYGIKLNKLIEEYPYTKKEKGMRQ